MNRRQFLGAAGLFLFATRVRSAFADSSLPAGGKPAKKRGDNDGPPVGPKNPDFASAHAAARRAGRPLLVVVVPDDGTAQYERGRLLGEYLNHGAPEQLAPLAAAEVACASMAEVRQHAPELTGEPLLVRIEPDGRARAIGQAVEIPKYDDRRTFTRSDAPRRPDDEITNERIALVAGLVRDAIPERPPAAAIARIRARLVERPPAGAHWANSAGCGTHVEKTPEEKEAIRLRAEWERKHGVFSTRMVTAVGCGMGMVPEKSRRFLSFFATADDSDDGT